MSEGGLHNSLLMVGQCVGSHELLPVALKCCTLTIEQVVVDMIVAQGFTT